MAEAPPISWPMVQLLHELPDGSRHVDWMIATDSQGAGPLVTFRIASRVDELEPGVRLEARRIADHRPEYLHREGPVSDDRGTVRRLAAGVVIGVDERPEALWLQVRWSPGGLAQLLRLRRLRPDGDEWTVEARIGSENAGAEAGDAGGDGESGSLRWEDDDQKGKAMVEELNQPGGVTSGRIQQSQPRIARAGPSRREDEPAPLPVAESLGQVAAGKRITAFEKAKRHEETWNRTPNTTGQGAIHVKTFHAKLTDDALAYMDQCINEWLDSHPQYEVKFVNSTVGVLTGKLKEPHLLCQVWV